MTSRIVVAYVFVDSSPLRFTYDSCAAAKQRLKPMHHVSRLIIKNFRSCRDVAISLSPFTPIVGYNNGGKSNILTALEWLLSPTKLPGTDFWDSVEPVVVEATIAGVDAEVLDLLSDANRKKVEPYLSDGTISVRRTVDGPDVAPGKTTDQVRDPTVLDDASPDAWKPNPGGIWAAIKNMFPEPIRVGAMENSAEDAAKFKTTSTLGRLIAELTEPIVKDCTAEFDKAIKTVTDQLDAEGTNRPATLTDFDRDATAAAAEFFPGIALRLHIPTPALNDFLKTGTLKVYEHATQREFEALGHGAQRSIQMALIRLLAERKQGASPGASTRLLLIDEPELYLHPQSIEKLRDALRDLTAVGYQVVFSTHSPIMIEAHDVPSTAMIVKTAADGTAVRPTIRTAVETALSDNESQVQLLFSVSNASQILFSEAVFLAEGKTERRLLPILYQHIQKETLSSARIALVNLGGVTSLFKSFAVLRTLGFPVRAVVDLDYAFQAGRRCGDVDDTDPDITACIAVLASLKVAHGFAVDAEGLPCKGGDKTAAEAYELLAADATAIPHIQNLHDKLIPKDIWMWTRGAVEAHLGLVGKNEAAWSQYAKRLESERLADVVTDLTGVTAFIQWAGTLPY